MPTKYKATDEEYMEVWQKTCVLWDNLNKDGGMISTPWSEYGFKIGIFKTTLTQTGWVRPAGLR